MKRAEVIGILGKHRTELQEKFGVKTLFLFGSAARDEATESSDVDLLVDFARPMSLFGLFALNDYLESLLGCPVDVGTLESLKPRIRERVMAERIHALSIE